MNQDNSMVISDTFTLPIGLNKNGFLYRKGRLRLPTNMEILQIGDDPDLEKYADCKIEITEGNINLARIMKLATVRTVTAMAMLPLIVTFEGLDEFTKADVKNMYPSDTQYLMELSDKLAIDAGEGRAKSRDPLSSDNG